MAAADEPTPTPDGEALEVRADAPTQVGAGGPPVQPELDDVDCCIRHYVQWVNGRPRTGRCSEAVDPDQVAAATPAPDGARVATGGTWSIEHSHVLARGGLTVPCEPTCGIEQGHHEVRDVWRSAPRPLPKVAYEPVLIFRGDAGEDPE